jgi:hypothetical protein
MCRTLSLVLKEWLKRAPILSMAYHSTDEKGEALKEQQLV